MLMAKKQIEHVSFSERSTPFNEPKETWICLEDSSDFSICLNIKELAEQISTLDLDKIICLFKEVDNICCHNRLHSGFDFNDALKKWFDKRSPETNLSAPNKKVNLADYFDGFI